MTTAVVDLGPVVKSVDVRRSARDAFCIFTDEISAWWPMKTHSRARDALGQVTVKVTIEPRVGGRVYETLNDGVELEWGEVAAYEPNTRFAMHWHMGRGLEQATLVSVRFEPLDANSTRVTLTHENWVRMGAEAETLRSGYANGWVTVFEKGFAQYANQ
ncbi:MAG: SRPBCC domain-containing protein [Alphaproteobacteria bacterium]